MLCNLLGSGSFALADIGVQANAQPAPPAEPANAAILAQEPAPPQRDLAPKPQGAPSPAADTQAAVFSGVPELQEVADALAAARDSGALAQPDNANWREVINLAEAAKQKYPSNPDVLRFSAQVYSEVGWYARAWDNWHAYLNAGGTLAKADEAQLAAAAFALGFARYSGGDKEGAQQLFEEVSLLEPQNQDALTWLGRITFEQGESRQSLSYWRRLLGHNPDNAAAKYYLARTKEQLKFGVAAAQAYEAGLQALSANDQAAALDAFSQSAAANPAFDSALLQAGRLALSAGRAKQAEKLWQRFLQRHPHNLEAQNNLRVAQAQQTWGVAAGKAFYEGQLRYGRGQVADAAEAFIRASDANKKYLDAAIWAARSLSESGQTKRAVPYWRRVLALRPKDATATFYLRQAQAVPAQQAALETTLNDGIAAYQAGKAQQAAQIFKAITQKAPDDAAAWAWLGRLAFERGDKAEAVRAYQKAVGLEPQNATYAYYLAAAKNSP